MAVLKERIWDRQELEGARLVTEYVNFSFHVHVFTSQRDLLLI